MSLAYPLLEARHCFENLMARTGRIGIFSGCVWFTPHLKVAD